MRFLRLFIGLAFGCAVILYFLGDFTPYVGEPDRDINVTEPSALWRLAGAIAVAVMFAAFSTLLYALTGRLFAGFRITRLFLITAIGLACVVYVYGPFKSFNGEWVDYELPWGTDRLLISAVCGAVLAAVATFAACVCWAVSHEWKQIDAR